MGWEFIILEALNKAGVADIGNRIQVRNATSCDNLVDLRKVRVFPVSAHTFLFGILEGGIINSAFQISALIQIQELIHALRNQGLYLCSEHRAGQKGWGRLPVKFAGLDGLS